MQAPLAEISDPFAAKRVSFGREERSLELRRPAKTPDRAGSADHPVIRQPRIRRLSQNVADRPRRTWPSGASRDIAVGRYTSCRNSGNDAKDAVGERRASYRIASAKTRPSARGSVMPASSANVGARSAGVAVVR